MGWRVYDPEGINTELDRVVFHTQQAANSQARFLNARDKREEEDVD